MDDPTVRRLIEASSLGTPDAARLRAATDDATAARIVARAEQLDAAPSCVSPDCALYYCPTVGDVECPVHGGFDVCCNRLDLHQPITRASAQTSTG